MVYATTDPAVLRVVIPSDETDFKRTEIELLVRAAPEGLVLKYNHHRIYSRPYPNAAWSNGHTMEVTVQPNSVLAHTYETLAISELLNAMPCRWEVNPDA